MKPKISVVIGNFDGMHLGHQLLFNVVLKLAEEHGFTPAVATFSPHPAKIYSDVKLIYTEEQREALIRACGIKDYNVIPFDKAFATLTPDEFLIEYLVGRLNVGAVAVGSDFHFGSHRAGTPQLLKTFCEEHGIICHVLDKLSLDGNIVSSTAIRDALGRGDIGLANRYLGRDMEYIGRVVEGDRIGATIGFPTANLQVYNEQLPADGVYAGYVVIEGQCRPAMVYVGLRPTLKTKLERRFEVHIIDYTPEKSLYGATLRVSLTHRLRGERKFNSLDELQAQLRIDKEAALLC
ncbi:bifunctional riboflavin kinase/FAD synthetase [Deferribacterales bacterium RsTz2092]|nr:riboflavin biosynthesis protein [Deferribacterales bacterium]